MSLSRAIETGDLTLLPSRRDEDWRWTDLRGLIRHVPAVVESAPSGKSPWQSIAGSGEHFRFVAGQGSRAGKTDSVFAAGSRTLVLESYEPAEGPYLHAVERTLVLEAGAHLERLVLADDGPEGVTVSAAHVILAPGASFTQTVLTTGAKRQRFETHITHPGQGASVRLDGAYLVGEKRHADLTTVVTHTGEGGTTSQLTKGAVAGQGRGVFQGRIVVERGADKTDAKMGHHALILDDRAEVDAKPELLIYADDVACAHGNTVGQLDEQAIFYAMQRGIPLAEARAMLTEAFVGEVIDRIEHEGARDIARAWAAEKLRGLAG